MTLKSKLIVRFVVGLLIFGLILFLPAGTLRFWEAWVFLSIWFILGFFFSIYFYKHDPALVERRMHRREKVKEQKWIMTAAYVVFFGAYLIPGLDYRFGWTHKWAGAVPLWLKIVSLGVVLAGYLMTIWVMDVNRYASAVIEVEAGQKVISTGPYKWVRHPMYFGVLFMMIFAPLALGSYVAAPFFLLIIPILVVRLLNEEKVLRRELSGYTEYCQGTRYRLVPHVW
jgi:protein-S-isoprenylcysteine O-methyltransferase Ste14